MYFSVLYSFNYKSRFFFFFSLSPKPIASAIEHVFLIIPQKEGSTAEWAGKLHILSPVPTLLVPQEAHLIQRTEQSCTKETPVWPNGPWIYPTTNHISPQQPWPCSAERTFWESLSCLSGGGSGSTVCSEIRPKKAQNALTMKKMSRIQLVKVKIFILTDFSMNGSI